MRPMTARCRGRGRWAKAEEEEEDEEAMIDGWSWEGRGGCLLEKKPRCGDDGRGLEGVVTKRAYSFLLCCACVWCVGCGVRVNALRHDGADEESRCNLPQLVKS